jgi:SAM-dependent methyltransferase
MGVAYFEELYRERDDPWELATSDYERRKYAATIAALDGRRYARGLEVGCSIGTLSALLAESCDRLLAVDCAPTAVARARERLAGTSGVRVERRCLPEEMPSGEFDLIVCSEVLYYWSPELLRETLARLRGGLAPGGSLLAVHWRGAVRHYPMDGDAAHAILLEEWSDVAHARRLVCPRYRIDRLDAAAA